MLKEKTQSQTTARDALQMALGGIKIPGSLTFDGVTATGWLADFLAQLDGRTELSTSELKELFALRKEAVGE